MAGGFGILGSAIGGIFGGPVGGLIGSGLGGLLDSDSVSSGQTAANNQNVELSREAMNFNSAEAAKNRAFQKESVERQLGYQEHMSSTAYTRAVGDMREAGLNPMLAYSQGGASSPAGASASGSTASGSPARVENAVAPGVATAYQSARLVEDLKNVQAQNALIEAQTEKTRQEKLNLGFTAANLVGTNTKIAAEVRQINKEIDKKEEEMNLIKSETERNKFYVEELLPLELLQRKMEAQLTDLELPGAINRSSAEGSWLKRNISPYMSDVGKGAEAVRDLGSTYRNIRGYRK